MMKSIIKASAFILILLLASYVIPADAGTTYYFGGAKKTFPTGTTEVAAGYYDATSLTTLFPGLAAGNIKSGTTLFGINGTYGAGGMLPPTLTTTAVSNITDATATSGGNISTDGGSPVTAHGVCWNTSAYPTTANSHTTDGTGTGSFPSSLTGLTADHKYYVRAYATNSAGTAYGDQVSFITSPAVIAIGHVCGGGIIFYVDGTGLHGLIAALSDQSSGMWYNGGDYTYTYASGAGVGTGRANTDLIISVYGEGTYAAKICANYSVTVEGVTYDGWFLPSRDELSLMRQQRSVIGGFAANGCYWSSTEYEYYSAWYKFFGDGVDYNEYKSRVYGVRAIRAF